jgi:hypothetical protein
MKASALPPFFESVEIQFSSLRNKCYPPGYGVVLDVDEIVTREAYRVPCGGSWKWRIKGFAGLIKYDSCVEQDQEILDEIGPSNLVEIVK